MAKKCPKCGSALTLLTHITATSMESVDYCSRCHTIFKPRGAPNERVS